MREGDPISDQEAGTKRAYEFARDVYEGYGRANGPQFAAAIAYHTLFAIAPLTLVLVAVAGWALGDAAALDGVSSLLRTVLGQNGAQLAKELIVQASRPTSGVVASVIGVLFAVVGGARAFVQLQAGMNRIWGVTPRPGTQWWRVARKRLIPFGMVGGTALGLLLAALARSALSTALDLGAMPSFPVLQGIALTVLLILAVFGLLVFVFRVLPDVEVEWRFVWFGAGLSTAAVSLVTWALQYYVARSAVGSVFGAAGSLVAVMLWAYASAQAVLIGAEITAVVADRRGSPLQPASYAVRVLRTIEDEEASRRALAREAEKDAE